MMKILSKLSVLALVATLAACQHAAPGQQGASSPPPEPVDPAPPKVTGPGAAAAPSASRPATPVSASSQQQTAVVITLHLAQQQAEPSLIEVDAGGQPLYALPQPVLTQGDMARVTPVTAQDGRSHLLLEMNVQGIPKLHTITKQARGHYFLLSVQGQLVSVAQIGDPIADGRLLVSTQNREHTQAIIQMMRGG